MAEARRFSLRKVVGALHKRYGRPQPIPARSAFELVLWENVAYLADDEKRARAFRELKAEVGVSPIAIAEAPKALLERIAGAGILAAGQVAKLRIAADVAIRKFRGDFQSVLRLPFEQARKALQAFPGIGEPGAEKILLLTKSHPVLALDSNGLRVLLRLGFGREQKSYAASYRSAQQAASAELGSGFEPLVRAHHVLRRHGQETCRRTRPRCDVCAVAPGCLYFLRGRPS